MNYLERKKPAVFKPIIDDYFLRIAQWAGVDAERVKKILETLNANRYSGFEYLYTAARKVKSVLFIEKVEAQLNYGYSRQIFNSIDINYVYVGESEYDYDPAELESDDYAVILDNYPSKAAHALRQDKFWGGNVAEVVGVWLTKEGLECVYKATPKEFVILGADPIDYFEQVIAAGFGVLPPYTPPPPVVELVLPSFLPLLSSDDEEEDGDDEEKEAENIIEELVEKIAKPAAKAAAKPAAKAAAKPAAKKPTKAEKPPKEEDHIDDDEPEDDDIIEDEEFDDETDLLDDDDDFDDDDDENDDSDSYSGKNDDYDSDY
jgi:hypothetical protein